MKLNNESRGKGSSHEPEDTTKKAVKLKPIKKSGKERHTLYSSLDDEDEDEAIGYRKRESVLDYFDDMEENEDIDEDQLDDDIEDAWEDERDREDDEEE